MAYDFGRFALQEMTECGVAVRRIGQDAGAAMEDVAAELARFFYTAFEEPETKRPAVALVRVYKTHPYAELDDALRAFADARRLESAGAHGDASARCLALLGTAGDVSEWNDRRASADHQAIPLGAAAASKSPLMSRLVRHFESSGAPADAGPLLEPANASYNVLHVEEAAGSPFVAAQDSFVAPHKIRSIVGFGGLLPSGDVFGTILFTKVHVPAATAKLFKALALNVKMALLLHERRVFRA